MIHAHNATLRIGPRLLLDRISLALTPGTLTAVLGPNGSGKTTLLRVLSGALRPSEGTVTLDGHPLHTLSATALARRRAVLGQHQALEFGLTTEDVVSLGRLPHAGTPLARSDHAAITACCADFALTPLWRRPYPSLSGGERQRVQLARIAAQLWRATPGAPQIVFLDEPTAALDVAQQMVAIDFARRTAKAGAAVLAILHDLNQAAQADHVILLRDGRILDQGPPLQVLHPPALQDCFGIAVEAVRRLDGGIGLLPVST